MGRACALLDRDRVHVEADPDRRPRSPAADRDDDTGGAIAEGAHEVVRDSRDKRALPVGPELVGVGQPRDAVEVAHGGSGFDAVGSTRQLGHDSGGRLDLGEGKFGACM